METRFSRRGFLQGAAACVMAAAAVSEGDNEPGVPLIDFHVHLDKSTIDAVVALGIERGVKFGIVEHAGTKENQYPVVLSNDEELRAYCAMLDGKGVYKGVQAEWTDWMTCFSMEALAELDYILTDAMTFPDRDGMRRKLWEKDADLGDPVTFMDRYVDWYVSILEGQPIDILANVSWLPGPFAEAYDTHWTEARMERVIEAAVKNEVAIEISAGFSLPRLPFLKMARALGAKFCFGTNGRYPEMGKIDYAVQMARELGLTREDMFTPHADGPKPVRRVNRQARSRLSGGLPASHSLPSQPPMPAW